MKLEKTEEIRINGIVNEQGRKKKHRKKWNGNGQFCSEFGMWTRKQGGINYIVVYLLWRMFTLLTKITIKLWKIVSSCSISIPDFDKFFSLLFIIFLLFIIRLFILKLSFFMLNRFPYRESYIHSKIEISFFFSIGNVNLGFHQKKKINKIKCSL